MTFEPIGFFHGDATYKYAAPRQGVFDVAQGRVDLSAGHNFEMALRDLAGFERIWLLFVFDRNGGGWRPTTRPPVSAPGHGRVGIFASRAPYRPNPIGLSCVRLLSIAGRVLSVSECDLLDGTPILDIKPYVPAADAFPNARAGWVDAQPDAVWTVEVSSAFAQQAAFVRTRGGLDLEATARVQLAHDPFDASRKRVMRITDGEGILSLRMFRLHFVTDVITRTVWLRKIRSGYHSAELAHDSDPYVDKELHRAFAEEFGHLSE